MNEINVDQIIYGSYIKYDRLKELTLSAFRNSTATKINIYIDMYSILLGVYRANTLIGDYSVITSTIINLCAHLRSYFWFTHKVTSKIFIVNSTNTSRLNRQFYHKYNAKNIGTMHAFPRILDMVQHNISLMEILVPYLPDIFFIDGEEEVGVMILNTKMKQSSIGNNDPNIVISKDLYAYQLPAIDPSFIIYRPKKYKGQDESFYVDNSNVVSQYIATTRDRSSLDPHILTLINPALLSMIISLSNFPSRGLKSVYNIRTTCNKILQAIENRIMVNNYNYDYTLFKILQPENTTENIGNRFKAIDLNFQYSLYKDSPLANDMSWYINLIDDNAVRDINDKYFRANPLDLNRL